MLEAQTKMTNVYYATQCIVLQTYDTEFLKITIRLISGFVS